MDEPVSINYLDLALSLSETLDLVSPLLSQHQIRTAYIAWRIGEEYQLPESALEEIFFSSLLHDVGALTPDEKISIHENDYNKSIHMHCIYGEKILKQANLFQLSAKIIRHHHTEWKEWEMEEPSEIALLTQIVFLADEIERLIERDKHILQQHEEITELISKRAGMSYFPGIIDALKALAERESFWFECVSPSLPSVLRRTAPGQNAKIYQKDFLELSEVIKKLVDFRSHFTATHSTGVSASATHLAGIFGYPQEDIEMIRFAANIHDVGKLAISNTLLEKSAGLTSEEFAAMKEHAYHTILFMRQCGLPEHLVEWAGYHHEKLNGTGYPLHKQGNEISHGARIIAAADVLTALTEERPYRNGMKKEGVLAIMDGLVNADHLDGDNVHTIKTHYDDIVGSTLAAQHAYSIQYQEDADYLIHENALA